MTAFHAEVVDRVDEDVVDMPEMTRITLSYDPFIGRMKNGLYNTEQQQRHDSWLLRAQQAAVEATESDAYRRHLDEWLWQAISTMRQFTFDPTLGTYGAEAFQKEPNIYYKLAKRQPSQTVHLIWRMLRDRQSKGHRRIVVYSESTVMLTIARNYMAKAGHCGALFLFTGALNAQQRDIMIKDFLSENNPKGVLFMSSAGAIGTNICPGCDTMFVIGDLPWNNSDLQQAFGRVRRITQDKPVEIVVFEPRRSVTSAILSQHEDKRERLEKAMRDEDWTNFSSDVDERWRQMADLTMNLTTLDSEGNYKMTKEMDQLLEDWKEACDQADAAGNPRPAKPAACNMPEAKLADDIALPPVSYPVMGFVEPSSDVEDESDDAEAEEEALTKMFQLSKMAGKRAKPMVDQTEEGKKKLEQRLKTLKQIASVDGNKKKKKKTAAAAAASSADAETSEEEEEMEEQEDEEKSDSEESFVVSDDEEEAEDEALSSDDDDDEDYDREDAGVRACVCVCE